MLNGELKSLVEVKKARAVETRDASQNLKRAVAENLSCVTFVFKNILFISLDFMIFF